MRTESGELWAWGWNEHGNVGVGESVEWVREPRRVCLPIHCDESTDGLLTRVGRARASTPTPRVYAVAVGAAHTLVIATLPEPEG